LVETPEETVRQEYLCVLVNEYGYELAQIEEEASVAGRGSGSARADFLIWRTASDREDRRAALIAVECKAEKVTIRHEDYAQGENYARYANCKFFVTHNVQETKYWRVNVELMPKSFEEIEDIPPADASDAEIEEIVSRLKEFKGSEFADLLQQCHNVIRNREKKDPAAAFDEIAKILFIKVWAERQLKARRERKNRFTTEVLDEQLSPNPLDDLFLRTKEYYESDFLFREDDRINLKPGTGREIVKRLERYDLSGTDADVKGIAFERFLGRTFRGEIGQFFTPRPIVDFMIQMVAPREGEIVCDPAAGSGGFLIRVFQLIREQIRRSVRDEYEAYRDELASGGVPDDEAAKLLRDKFAELEHRESPEREGSREWILANKTIFGTDANDRMARTSKMNMIMHGDGHGGVHHHDGFLNVNGIFEGRFDVILTNPPFGATVEPSDTVDEESLFVSPAAERRYRQEFGDAYVEARERVKAALHQPIATLFQLPSSPQSKIRTEILFLERCLDLLKPGGRLGIVLPEGVLNNPSLRYVREFAEDRAFVQAVVSVPQETFRSAGADVKASLVFLRKFDDVAAARYAECHATAAEEGGSAAEQRARCRELFNYPIFLYEAEHVGITATGEDDSNELLPDGPLPADVSESALAAYQRFRTDPDGFVSADSR
jgi:type I restriction enzyme M protein